MAGRRDTVAPVRPSPADAPRPPYGNLNFIGFSCPGGFVQSASSKSGYPVLREAIWLVQIA
jgi:hypothetical protein